MIPLAYFFIFLASIVCAYISYIDFKKGIVPNKAVLLLLIIALIYRFFEPAPFLPLFISLISVAFFSFLLWFAGLWPAGDAKFFIALTLLFPGAFYSNSTLLFDFLANIFVPIFLFMLVVIFLKTKSKLFLEALRYSLDPYNISMLAMILFGFVWFISKAIFIFIPKVSGAGQYLISLLLILVVYEIFRRVMSAKLEVFFFICALARVILDFWNIYTLAFLWNFASLLVVFIFFRFFVLYLAFRFYTEPVKISKLKPGMSPAELIVKHRGKYKKISLLSASLLGFLFKAREQAVHDTNFLTKEDVARIKELYRQKKLGFSTLLVNKTQPFAVFIFAGYLLTLFASGNAIKALLIFLHIIK